MRNEPIYTLVQGPQVLPVTVMDCKSDLRIDGVAEDALIGDYIEAAAKVCSEIIGKQVADETWKLSVQRINRSELVIERIPVKSITSIEYYDTDEVLQTLNPADFLLYNFEGYALLEPKTNAEWPATALRKDAIMVTFVTGMDIVPASVQRAIRLLVAHWYETRTSVVLGTIANTVPHGVEMLLSTERTGWVA